MAHSSEADIIREWSHDILKYIRDTLGAEPTAQQAKALLEFRDLVWAKIRVSKNIKPTDRDKELCMKFGMSIMSGVGTGKGAFGSWCILWFMTCFPFPKIAVTSPSQKQLAITLWAELAKWHQKSKVRDWFTWQAEKFFLNEHGGQQWFAAQRTANTRNSPDEQAETLAGLHENFVLIIADEASGIPDPVFRPLESTLTGMCNLCLLLFNPTRAKGFAFETHNRDRENWVQVHWNAEESDNVSKESIERYANKYGRESNFFKIRVLGIPPSDSEQTVIPWAWIQDAIERDVEINEDDRMLMSLDVGAGGDDSSLLKRLGPRIFKPEVASFTESNLLVDWAVRAALASEPKAFLVDNIGVGWGVSGSLREKLKRHDIDVVEVNVSNQAYNSHKFFRLRDELWWRLRGEFEKGIISLPDDPLLQGELNLPRYEEVAGKIKVETKKELKARGIESPNRADSLMMTEVYESDLMRKLYVPLHKKNAAAQKAQKGSWKTA
jgi:phage terminase large subunit